VCLEFVVRTDPGVQKGLRDAPRVAVLLAFEDGTGNNLHLELMEKTRMLSSQNPLTHKAYWYHHVLIVNNMYSGNAVQGSEQNVQVDLKQ